MKGLTASIAKQIIVLLSGLLLQLPTAIGQSAKIDSLLNRLHTAPTDTALIIDILNSLNPPLLGSTRGDSLISSFQVLAQSKKHKKIQGLIEQTKGRTFHAKGEFEQAIPRFNAALKTARSIENSTLIAANLQYIASSYFNLNKSDSAIAYINEAIGINKQLNDLKRLSVCYNTLGGIYWSTGNYAKAVETFYETLRIKEQQKDTIGMANITNNIGIVFETQNNTQQAIDLYLKALELYEKANHLKGIGLTSNNIGILYKNTKDYSKALKFLNKSLEIDKKLGNKNELGKTLNNIGELQREMGNYPQSEESLLEAYALFEETQNINGKAATLINLGALANSNANHTKAQTLFSKALTFAEQSNNPEWKKECYKGLYTSFKGQNNQTSALKYHERYMQVSDSLKNIESLKIQDELKVQYESEKKEQAITLLNQQKALDTLKIRRQHTLNIFLLIASVLLITSISIIYISLVNKRKHNKNLLLKNAEISQQKEEIETQRDLLEDLNNELGQQNEEILAQRDYIENQNNRLKESIKYAFRIQKALLPDLNLLKGFFANQQILFKPKDIVSGDFYWIYPHGESILFAAVDCTGHGVAGAFMSLLAYDMLKNATIAKGLSNPEDIVNSINNDIDKNLYINTDPYDIKDGMDLVVCCFNPKLRTLEYCGAHSSFAVIRSTGIETYKTDRYTIGSRIAKETPYKQESINVLPGDRIALFTDGYIDQIDGQQGKKIGIAQFRGLLQKTASQPLHQQKEFLEHFLYDWRGDYEQIDDVLVWLLEV
ncbi:MAG: tetratricopeptide repeat protein [Bacteroidales bacterium]|nr:tetratricopeptide repeat protein [Bacteroidales bacterium]MBN2748649.1 tetratricopeptide repeat protein [Bacteroidales bacterium]